MTLVDPKRRAILARLVDIPLAAVGISFLPMNNSNPFAWEQVDITDVSHHTRNNPSCFWYDVTQEVGIAKSKGDLLLKLGRANDAIALYSQEIEKPGLKTKFIGFFSRAWAYLQEGKEEFAVEDLSKAAVIWKNHYAGFLGDTILNEYDYDAAGEKQFAYFSMSPLLCIKWVCIAFLKKEKDTYEVLLSSELRGWLFFVLYKYMYANEGQFFEYLLAAEQLDPHPALGYDLASYFTEQENIPNAVKYHLTFFLWKYSVRQSYGDYKSNDAEFHLYDKSHISSKVRCKKIHRVALLFLKQVSDPHEMQEVMLPFYTSFWRDFLIQREMFKEVVEVASTICAVASHLYRPSWDCAYYLYKLEKSDDAEKAYKHVLEIQPNDISALHNLSVIMNNKHMIREALTLAEKAAILAPENEIIVKNHAGLKEKMASLQKKHQKIEMLKKASDLEEQGEIDEAEKMYLLCLQQWPDNAIASHSLAHIYEMKEQEQKALEFFRKSIDLDPANQSYKDCYKKAQESLTMKELLNQGDLQYFLMATVDFCIFDVIDYEPLVTFEIDSEYHDNSERVMKDEQKDRIFKCGRIPLLRIRPGNETNEDMLRKSVREVVQAWRNMV